MAASSGLTDEEARLLVAKEIKEKSKGAYRVLQQLNSDPSAPSAIMELLRHSKQNEYFEDISRQKMRASGLMVDLGGSKSISKRQASIPAASAGADSAKGESKELQMISKAAAGDMEAATMLKQKESEERISAAMTTHDDELFFIHDPMLPTMEGFFAALTACARWAELADSTIADPARPQPSAKDPSGQLRTADVAVPKEFAALGLHPPIGALQGMLDAAVLAPGMTLRFSSVDASTCRYLAAIVATNPDPSRAELAFRCLQDAIRPPRNTGVLEHHGLGLPDGTVVTSTGATTMPLTEAVWGLDMRSATSHYGATQPRDEMARMLPASSQPAWLPRVSDWLGVLWMWGGRRRLFGTSLGQGESGLQGRPTAELSPEEVDSGLARGWRVASAVGPGGERCFDDGALARAAAAARNALDEEDEGGGGSGSAGAASARAEAAASSAAPSTPIRQASGAFKRARDEGRATSESLRPTDPLVYELPHILRDDQLRRLARSVVASQDKHSRGLTRAAREAISRAGVRAKTTDEAATRSASAVGASASASEGLATAEAAQLHEAREGEEGEAGAPGKRTRSVIAASPGAASEASIVEVEPEPEPTGKPSADGADTKDRQDDDDDDDDGDALLEVLPRRFGPGVALFTRLLTMSLIKFGRATPVTITADVPPEALPRAPAVSQQLALSLFPTPHIECALHTSLRMLADRRVACNEQLRCAVEDLVCAAAGELERREERELDEEDEDAEREDDEEGEGEHASAASSATAGTAASTAAVAADSSSSSSSDVPGPALLRTDGNVALSSMLWRATDWAERQSDRLTEAFCGPWPTAAKRQLLEDASLVTSSPLRTMLLHRRRGRAIAAGREAQALPPPTAPAAHHLAPAEAAAAPSSSSSSSSSSASHAAASPAPAEDRRLSKASLSVDPTAVRYLHSGLEHDEDIPLHEYGQVLTKRGERAVGTCIEYLTPSTTPGASQDDWIWVQARLSNFFVPGAHVKFSCKRPTFFVAHEHDAMVYPRFLPGFLVRVAPSASQAAAAQSKALGPGLALLPHIHESTAARDSFSHPYVANLVSVLDRMPGREAGASLATAKLRGRVSMVAFHNALEGGDNHAIRRRRMAQQRGIHAKFIALAKALRGLERAGLLGRWSNSAAAWIAEQAVDVDDYADGDDSEDQKRASAGAKSSTTACRKAVAVALRSLGDTFAEAIASKPTTKWISAADVDANAGPKTLYTAAGLLAVSLPPPPPGFSSVPRFVLWQHWTRVAALVRLLDAATAGLWRYVDPEGEDEDRAGENDSAGDSDSDSEATEPASKLWRQRDPGFPLVAAVAMVAADDAPPPPGASATALPTHKSVAAALAHAASKRLPHRFKAQQLRPPSAAFIQRMCELVQSWRDKIGEASLIKPAERAAAATDGLYTRIAFVAKEISM